ncbi:MAG: flotillin-like protein FloA [Fibrobacteres bacterium]|nr:flotillin-like protein FloA [Fibrobacterota bacterium]
MEYLVVPVVLAALVFFGFFFYLVPVRLWFEAFSSGVSVSIVSLIGMRFRSVNPYHIIRPLISARKAGINDLTSGLLEAHYMAIGTKNPAVGARMNNLVKAIISAEKANLKLSIKQATAIDLAGRDVVEAVTTSVIPKIIETPLISGVAKDGIQVKALARVTVRTNIDRLVGGAGENTIIARVGEGIVTAIGSSDTHKMVLENPDMISKVVLKKGLDAGTAFEILSIDIADVDIGKNIGAQLQTDQAEADKKIAQAKAEERRAMAVATEQEMTARIAEMRAKVVENEAKIPMAMANAFEKGNLGIMDYYKMKNIMADTDMRASISKEDK